MSVNVYWEPSRQNSRHLIPGGKSWLVGALENVFGSLPRTLDDSDLPTLEAMAAACERTPNPFSEIVEAIKLHTFIEITAG